MKKVILAVLCIHMVVYGYASPFVVYSSTTMQSSNVLAYDWVLTASVDAQNNKWFGSNGVAIEETKTPMYQILTNDTGIEIAGLQGGEMITLYDLNGKELCCKIAEGNSSSIHYTKLQKVVVKIDQQAFVVSF